MERKQVTCPETAHREEVGFERTPSGIVIASCTRFPGELACTRGCAHEMDRRDRVAIDDRSERVLVVYASDRSGAKPIAEALARRLARDGFIVELADAHEAVLPPPDDYDAVVIGSPVHFGEHARSVLSYIETNRGALATMPAFFFTVGRWDAVPASVHIDHMIGTTGWRPMAWAALAGTRATAVGGRADIDAFALRIADCVPAIGIVPSFA